MDMTTALARLRKRRLVLVVAAVLGVVAFVLVTWQVGSSGLTRKGSTHGVAQAELLVDSERSALVRISNLNGELADRAILVAQFAQSPSIRKRMAEALGRPRDSFDLVADTSALGGASGETTPASNGTDPARPLPAAGEPAVVFSASGGLPVVRVSGQAATAAEAERLTTAARAALVDTVSKIGGDARPSGREGASAAESYPLLLRPVSATSGETVTTRSSLGRGAAIGLGVFVLLSLLSLLPGRRAAASRPATPAERAGVPAREPVGPGVVHRNGRDRPLVPAGAPERPAGDPDRDDA